MSISRAEAQRREEVRQRTAAKRQQKLADQQKVAVLFEQRKTDAEIATALGMTPRQIQKLRLDAGLKRPGAIENALKVDEEWLRREYDERIRGYHQGGDRETRNQRMREVARDAGVDERTIRRHLQSMGLIEKEEASCAKSPAQWRRAEALLNDGLPYREVSRQVKINVSTLRERHPGKGIRPEDKGAFLQAMRLERKLGL